MLTLFVDIYWSLSDLEIKDGNSIDLYIIYFYKTVLYFTENYALALNNMIFQRKITY